MACTASTAFASLVTPVEIVNPATKAAKVFSSAKVAAVRPVRSLTVRAQKEEASPSTSRRSLLNLLAASVAAGALSAGSANAIPIKVEGPPPPSGGLPGTKNSDEARDTDLPLKDRFFIQKVSSKETAARLKTAVDEIVGVKPYLDKQAWTSARNDLRNRGYYLRTDIDTLIGEKPKASQKALKAEAKSVIELLELLDDAARTKNPVKAASSYVEAVSALNGLVAKLT
eukprot:TRINITY_DN20227_c0_g1_i1.p1 TRINITY_DN20227_c0_g1~~TRINITY_DN20227_c0_g1_i1.p1  ORF type:complete len:228 (-),score=71.16 TRINITY_DN20227_c0_g1_i1:343-1026(-)